MTLPGLEADQLAAVASVWRRERRRFNARFGGASMSPAIPPGAELEVACGEPVAPGDVAVLVVEGRVLVHRVAAVLRAEGWILTRGDATALPDLPAPLSCVLGRVAGIRNATGSHGMARAPESLPRRALLGSSLWLLARWPAGARGFVQGLWALRRWLVAYPAALRRRLRRGALPIQEEDQAEPAQPARQ